MKGRVIALGRYEGRAAAALLVNGRLEDLFLAAIGGPVLQPDAILRGQVGRILKGQGGAFVRLPDGHMGYLRSPGTVTEGQPVIAQVAALSEPGKAIPLTARIRLKGRLAITTPGKGGINLSRRIRDKGQRARLQAVAEAVLGGGPADLGAIIRSAAAEADESTLRDELTRQAALAHSLAKQASGPPALLVAGPDPADLAQREWGDPAAAVDESADAFQTLGVLDAIDALGSPYVALPGGAHAMIEPTRALIAVDVNTGADGSPAAALKANLALAGELPRQLRLRGLGGKVVVDFAPLSREARPRLESALQAAFRQDATETRLIGWTGLALYEINRKRDRAPLMQEGGD